MDRWMKKNYDFKSRRGILRWFLTCLTLFWMVFIFMMSSAGKDESNSQSGAVCEFICEHFVEGYEEMAPEEQIQMQQKISFPVGGAYDTHCGFLDQGRRGSACVVVLSNDGNYSLLAQGKRGCSPRVAEPGGYCGFLAQGR